MTNGLSICRQLHSVDEHRGAYRYFASTNTAIEEAAKTIATAIVNTKKKRSAPRRV